jgi:hypothetical protein
LAVTPLSSGRRGGLDRSQFSGFLKRLQICDGSAHHLGVLGYDQQKKLRRCLGAA